MWVDVCVVVLVRLPCAIQFASWVGKQEPQVVHATWSFSESFDQRPSLFAS